MSNEHGFRTAVVLFAITMIIAMIVAFFTTLERVDKRTANSETAHGTKGFAKAR
jgi:Na+/melibiose symporter-like transporter